LLLAALAAERLGLLSAEPEADRPVTDAPAAPAGAAAGDEAPVGDALAALEAFTVVGERTLFMPTRRPPEPPEAPAPNTPQPPKPPPPPPPDLEVHAIVREGERWIAVISRTRGGEPVQAQPGDTVHGWEVTAIDPETVQLRAGSRVVSLRLRPELVLPR
jgi:general secretion pathway protein N